ncbi:hypothetical protein ACVJDU_008674 [Bradyrhizobium diazoefficiens]
MVSLTSPMRPRSILQRRPRFSGRMSIWRDLATGREELLVGEIGAEHHQRVAGVHGGIARGEADEPGHADIVGIFVFDVLLAAERMHDRALQGLRKLHQRRMRAGAATAAEQGDALGAVQEVRERLQLIGLRHDFRRRQREPPRRRQRAPRRIAERDVAGHGDDGDAAQAHGRTNGVLDHERQLARIRDQLAIMAAFPEQVLGMGFLKVAAADFGRRNLRRDRQHGDAAAMRVEQAVDQMQIARAAGTCADRKASGHLGFAGGCERRNLLMPDVDPFDGAATPQRLGKSIQAVADDAVDPLDAGLFERCHEQIGHVVDRHVGLLISLIQQDRIKRGRDGITAGLLQLQSFTIARS